MKKNHSIKGALLHATLIASIFLFASCDNNQKQKGSKDVSENRNERKFDNNDQGEDAQFLVNVAESNLKEIQLGQLAQQNGQTLHVKELGKMMEDAHAKSQKDLMALAKRKNISIPNRPTENSNDTYLKLKEKSGGDFDKAYADKMVNAHEDAIDKFEKAADDSNDQEIRKWAKSSLPDLRKHLDHSIECQKKCEENKQKSKSN